MDPGIFRPFNPSPWLPQPAFMPDIDLLKSNRWPTSGKFPWNTQWTFFCSENSVPAISNWYRKRWLPISNSWYPQSCWAI
jgi:hypothetical protein